MADWKRAKLGAYLSERKMRVIVVPVDGPDEDPRAEVLRAVGDWRVPEAVPVVPKVPRRRKRALASVAPPEDGEQ